jgi:hypothetical protein
MRTLRLAFVLLAVMGSAAACSPGGPVKVAAIQLGKTLNTDNSVGNHTTRFKPDDTIYLAILTDEPGASKVTVRWLLNGQLVSEASRDVSHMRPAAEEFHLQNSGGFPAGQYRVDLLIDGKPAGSREFRVES